MKDKKIKILAHADSVHVNTGFGVVSRNILGYLAKTGKYEIDMMGVNDRGFYDPRQFEELPIRILPAMMPGVRDDFYGRVKFINIVRGADKILKPPYDIIWTLNDPFIYEEPVLTPEIGMMDALRDLQKLYIEKAGPEFWFKVASYWPIDAPIKGNWIEHSIGLADYSIAYTKYGKHEIEKANQALQKPFEFELSVIEHGTDIEDFHPITEKEKRNFRKAFFKKAKVNMENVFIVGIVARNQVRKDIPRAMKVFNEFQKRRPDSMLYIHARETDAWGSLNEYARNFNMEVGKDYIFPGNFDEATGYPVEALNKIYNIIDVQIQTTKGEGWGLPVTEAMATKTLNLAPNITSIPEIFNTEGDDYEDLERLSKSEIRGIPVKAGSTTSEWITDGPTDYERIRPLTNVDDMVKKLIWVYDNPDKTKPIIERGYEWIQKHTWEHKAKKWDSLLQKVYNDLEDERRKAQKPTKQEIQLGSTKT